MKHMGETEWQYIVEQKNVHGRNGSEIADEIGASAPQTVNRLSRLYDRIENGDWASVQREVSQSAINPDFLLWASQRIGVEIPASVVGSAFKTSKEKSRVKAEKDALISRETAAKKAMLSEGKGKTKQDNEADAALEVSLEHDGSVERMLALLPKDVRMSVTSGEDCVLKIRLTPEIAKAFLATSPGNPRWKKGKKLYDESYVKQIVEDIKQNGWKQSNTLICLGNDMRLQEGHHRCASVALSGEAVDAFVRFNAPEDIEMYIDDNKKRTESARTGWDFLTLAIPAVDYSFSRNLLNPPKNVGTQEKKRWIENHSLVEEAVRICSIGTSRTAISRKSGVAHGILCALEYGESPAMLERMFRSVNSGFYNGEEESAANCLRNTLWNWKADKLTAKELSCATQAAIWDYRLGVPRHQKYRKLKNGKYYDLLRKA